MTLSGPYTCPPGPYTCPISAFSGPYTCPEFTPTLYLLSLDPIHAQPYTCPFFPPKPIHVTRACIGMYIHALYTGSEKQFFLSSKAPRSFLIDSFITVIKLGDILRFVASRGPIATRHLCELSTKSGNCSKTLILRNSRFFEMPSQTQKVISHKESWLFF